MGVGRLVAWVEDELEILVGRPGVGTLGASLTPPVPPPILPPASLGSPSMLVRVPEFPPDSVLQLFDPAPGRGKWHCHAPHIDTGVHVKLNHRRAALRSLLLVGLAAGTVAGCNEAEPAEPTPAPLGTLSTIPNMRAEDVSSDGKSVLSTDLTSAAVDFYIYDVASGTNTLGGSAGDWMQDFATGISNGRRVSALYGNNPV